MTRARLGQASENGAAHGDVLCVDDDAVVQILLEEVVRLAGASYHGARSAQEAEAELCARRFDLILLDRRLPDSDGLLLIETARQRSDCPVVVLSELGCPQDRQLGLGLGAEEYLPKPFNPIELTGRIRFLLGREHRRREQVRSQRITLGELVFTPGERCLDVDGERQFLPPAESRLLCRLMERHGTVLSRDDLTLAACGRGWTPGDRTTDVLIARLRRKLPEHAAKIVTVHRLGYALHVSAPS
ncbi:MAG: response regulator transcription factor [Pseudomonadota bacterium]